MKKLMIFAAAYFAVSCAPEQGVFKVEGTTFIDDGMVITYMDGAADRDVIIATDTIKDGKFSFSERVDTLGVRKISISGTPSLPFTTYSGTTKIDVQQGKIVIEGDTETQKISEYYDKVNPLIMEINMMYPKLQLNRDSVITEIEAVIAKIKEFNRGAITEYADYYISSEAILDNIHEMTIEQLDSTLAVVSDKVMLNPKLRSLYLTKLNESRTQVGKPYIDIVGTDVENKEVAKLSEIAGKGDYVLLDFWASWCAPCREEIPVIKEVYEKYKSKGFKVVGINVWDKHAPFVKAKDDLGMTWDQIYASDDTSAPDNYGIMGIPTLILIAPDGTIEARGLRGEALKAKIEEVYAK